MKKIFKNALFYTIIYIIILIVFRNILEIYEMRIVKWVYDVSVIIICLSVIVGITQIVTKFFKNKIIPTIITIIVLLLILAPILMMFFCLSFTKEEIVTKNNEKLWMKITYFDQVHIYYYEYVNIFIRGNDVVDSKYYKTYNEYIKSEDYVH